MSAESKRQLVGWFARCDLFERQMLRTTRTIQRTICVVTLFLVASFGLALGYEKARRERIQSKCQALCLIASEPNVSDEVTADHLAVLDARFRSPDAAAMGARFMPYNVLRDVAWATPQGNGVEQLKGRTIDEADPLLSELISAKEFTSACPKKDLASRQGIVVTRKLLEILSVPVDPVPTELYLSTRRAGLHPVRVLGVTQERLLQGFLYLVPSTYYTDFRAAWSASPMLKIRSGALPPDSKLSDPKFTIEFSRKFSKKLNGIELLGRVQRENVEGGFAWQFSYQGPDTDPAKLSRKEWLKRLDEVKQWIREENVEVPAAFDEIENVERPAEETLAFPYDDLSVYVRDVEYLRPAFHLISDAFTPSLPVSEDKIDLAEDIAATTQTVVMLLWVVAGLLALIAATNLSTLLVLRADRQTTEIGMLKAMGMDQPLLRRIHIREGFLLWRHAAPAGLILGLVLGFIIAESACFLTGDPYRLRYVVPVRVSLVVTIASLPLCVLGILLANRRAHHSSAARCLAESV